MHDGMIRGSVCGDVHPCLLLVEGSVPRPRPSSVTHIHRHLFPTILLPFVSPAFSPRLSFPFSRISSSSPLLGKGHTNIAATETCLCQRIHTHRHPFQTNASSMGTAAALCPHQQLLQEKRERSEQESLIKRATRHERQETLQKVAALN
jgi:hypothetical protein